MGVITDLIVAGLPVPELWSKWSAHLTPTFSYTLLLTWIVITSSSYTYSAEAWFGLSVLPGCVVSIYFPYKQYFHSG